MIYDDPLCDHKLCRIFIIHPHAPYFNTANQLRFAPFLQSQSPVNRTIPMLILKYYW